MQDVIGGGNAAQNSFDASEGGEVSFSKLLLLVIPVLVLMLGGVWYGLSLVQPPPQREIVLSTGSTSGAYHLFATRYQAFLAREGVTMRLEPSAGAIENLKRLKDPATGVTAGLMQGGIGANEDNSGLVSVGRIFYEPVWVFYRGDTTLTRLAQLRDRRIAVGPENSGTRALALEMLKLSNVTPQSASLLPLGGQQAVDALLAGTVDVAMLTFAPEAPVLQKLVREPSVRLMSLEQADAMTRKLPYLARIVLPKGVFDFEQNIPSENIEMVAPVASLVVRADLHSSYAGLLAQAVTAVHGKATLLQKTGEFPLASDPTFNMSDDAVRFYKNGQPFLQRFLPFWLANFIERMLVLIVPLATIAIPIFKGFPALYRWRIRQKLHYWYGRLKRLEGRIVRGDSQIVSAAHRAELDTIDSAVLSLNVPRAFAQTYYDLRGHIDLVRSKLPG